MSERTIGKISAMPRDWLRIGLRPLVSTPDTRLTTTGETLRLPGGSGDDHVRHSNGSCWQDQAVCADLAFAHARSAASQGAGDRVRTLEKPHRVARRPRWREGDARRAEIGRTCCPTRGADCRHGLLVALTIGFRRLYAF